MTPIDFCHPNTQQLQIFLFPKIHSKKSLLTTRFMYEVLISEVSLGSPPFEIVLGHL